VTSSHGDQVFNVYVLAMFYNNPEINRNKLKSDLVSFFLCLCSLVWDYLQNNVDTDYKKFDIPACKKEEKEIKYILS
jgi:hypothetical protein